MARSPSFAALALVLTGTLVGCNKNVDKDAEMVITSQTSARSQAEAPAASQASGSGTLAGTIQLAPALASQVSGQEVLFLIARRPGGGPPLAVQKIVGPRFPMEFRLGPEDVMMEGFELAGEVLLTARLDQDGVAGPVAPGDLVGSAGPLPVGGPAVDLVIDQTGAGTAAPRVELPAAPPGDTMAAPAMTLDGTVLLDPSLEAQARGFPALYIIARTGEGGPPLAVKRVAAPSFPYRFQLSSADMMLQGRDFSGPVTVTARLDKDGAAGPAASGDLVGATPGTVNVGGGPFEITIREAVP